MIHPPHGHGTLLRDLAILAVAACLFGPGSGELLRAQVERYQDAEIPTAPPPDAAASDELSRQAWNQYDSAQYADARKSFESLIATDPGDEGAARGLILSTYRAGDPQKAYTLANSYESAIPNAKGVVIGMIEGDAWKLVDAKQYKKAKTLVDKFPSETALGKVREEIGRHHVEQALQAGRSGEAAALGEGFGLSQQSMTNSQAKVLAAQAEQLQATGKYRDSLKVLEQAEAVQPLDRGARKLRAWGLYHTRQFGPAAEQFESLYRQIPEKDVAEGLTYSLQQSGRVADLAAKSEELGGVMHATSKPVTEAVVKRERIRQNDDKKQKAAEDVGRIALSANGDPQASISAPAGVGDTTWAATTSGSATPGRVQGQGGGRRLMASSSRVALGAGIRVKQGDDGTSRLVAMELPSMGGEMVFGTNGAQSLGLTVRRFSLDSGGAPIRRPYGLAPTDGRLLKIAPVTRVDTLVEPRLAYRRESGELGLFAELGTTPIGGSISAAPVGAIGIDWKQPEYHWRAEVFSESVTESMLSWTGLRDPYSGREWGRVTETGVRAEMWHQIGRAHV